MCRCSSFIHAKSRKCHLPCTRWKWLYKHSRWSKSHRPSSEHGSSHWGPPGGAREDEEARSITASKHYMSALVCVTNREQSFVQFVWKVLRRKDSKCWSVDKCTLKCRQNTQKTNKHSRNRHTCFYGQDVKLLPLIHKHYTNIKHKKGINYNR